MRVAAGSGGSGIVAARESLPMHQATSYALFRRTLQYGTEVFPIGTKRYLMTLQLFDSRVDSMVMLS